MSNRSVTILSDRPSATSVRLSRGCPACGAVACVDPEQCLYLAGLSSVGGVHRVQGKWWEG